MRQVDRGVGGASRQTPASGPEQRINRGGGSRPGDQVRTAKNPRHRHPHGDHLRTQARWRNRRAARRGIRAARGRSDPRNQLRGLEPRCVMRPTFSVYETYGPRLVRLLQAIDLPAVSYRDVPGIESGDRDLLTWESRPSEPARRSNAVGPPTRDERGRVGGDRHLPSGERDHLARRCATTAPANANTLLSARCSRSYTSSSR